MPIAQAVSARGHLVRSSADCEQESSSIASDNSDNVGSNEKNTVFVGNQVSR
jgi:hypothetical protein